MSRRYDDGFQTIVTFAAGNPRLYIIELTPPSFKGGGEIDVANMHNISWRTRSPKKLITLGEITAKVAYETLAFYLIPAHINLNQLITVTFPDTATYSFWGFLDEFTPDSNKEGERPTATIKIIPTLHDNTTPVPTEIPPVFVDGV